MSEPDFETPPPAEGDLTSSYLVLFNRYQSNTDLQWRVPAFVLPVIIGALAGSISVNSTAVRVVLAFTALTAGLAGAMLMRRIEMTARWDRNLLDTYEAELLGEHPELRLMHGSSFDDRLKVHPAKAQSKLKTRIDGGAMKFEPSASVFALMVLSGAMVFLVAIALAFT